MTTNYVVVAFGSKYEKTALIQYNPSEPENGMELIKMLSRKGELKVIYDDEDFSEARKIIGSRRPISKTIPHKDQWDLDALLTEHESDNS